MFLPFVGLAATLSLVLWWVDPRAVARAIASSQPGWLAGALAFSLLSPVVVAGKLRLLLLAVEHPSSFRRCISAVLASITLNAVLPGRGGEFTRAIFLADSRNAFVPLLGAVLVERLVDVFALGLLAAALSAGAGTAGAPAWLGLAACAASLGGLGLLACVHRAPCGLRRWAPVGQALRRILARPRLAGAFLLASVLSWINIIAVMACCFRAIGAEVGLGAISRATPIAILAGTLPITVSGIGTRDTALLLLLRGEGREADIVAAAFLFTAVVFGVLPLVGLLALGREALRKLRASTEARASTEV